MDVSFDLYLLFSRSHSTCSNPIVSSVPTCMPRCYLLLCVTLVLYISIRSGEARENLFPASSSFSAVIGDTKAKIDRRIKVFHKIERRRCLT